VAQACGEGQAIGRVLVHAHVEEAEAAAPQALGVVHGHVGLLHQGVEIGAVHGGYGNTQGAGGGEGLAAQIEGRLQCTADLFGDGSKKAH
jgi:hypothetical protein